MGAQSAVEGTYPRLRRLSLTVAEIPDGLSGAFLGQLALDGPAAELVLNDMAAFSHLDRVYLPNLDTAPAGSNVIPELPRWPVV